MRKPRISLWAPMLGLLVAAGACSSSDTSGDAPADPSGADAAPPPGVPIGAPCTDDATCNGGHCASGACVAPSATDGVKDGDETDTDCGGSAAPPCADGKACLAATDCASQVCTGNVCAAPTPTDGVKNGDETDVDCGGATAPKCAARKACLAASDCVSGACRDGVCAEARSCAQKNGGATCGPGEVGDPAAVHEDCCTAAVVPRPVANGGPFMMDKYLITAGRMRVFLEAVGYDVRGWIAANRPAWWTGSGTSTWDAMLPTNKDEFISLMTNGGSGCFVGASAGQQGAPAFWVPAADLARVVGGAPRTYTQAELDTKVMNCFRAPLFHALCAFDGGRLPSRAEWIAARTMNGTVLPYPWGSNGTDADRRARAVYDFDYAWPREPAKGDTDLGGYLPAPGRFPLGNGPYGHADLLGSVENMGSQPTAGAGVTGDGWFQFSFQEAEQPSHPYGQQYAGFGSGAYRNHWAVGARCVKLP
jgi:formylglycine-generating enzyme required for sulfatase activity